MTVAACSSCRQPLPTPDARRCPACGAPQAGAPPLPAFAARVLWFWGMLMMVLGGAWLGLVSLGGAASQGSAAGYVLAGFVFLAGLALAALGFSRGRR